MARCSEYSREQTKLISIAPSTQKHFGTFQYTLNHLIDNEFDSPLFEQRYHDDETGAPAVRCESDNLWASFPNDGTQNLR